MTLHSLSDDEFTQIMGEADACVTLLHAEGGPPLLHAVVLAGMRGLMDLHGPLPGGVLVLRMLADLQELHAEAKGEPTPTVKVLDGSG